MGTERQFAKRAAAQAAGRLNRLLGSRSGDSLGILLYHRITDEAPGVPKPLYNVPPSRFRAQLEGLLQLGYRFWPLTRALHHHAAAKRFPPKTIVVTFDDGYESVFTNAWPILRELNIPATIFLATAFLDSDEPFPFDEWGMRHHRDAPPAAFRPMMIAQCMELQASGLIELAAHTHTHQDFRGRSSEFGHDLEKCVRFLRQAFALDDISFSFPYGKPSRGYVSRDLVRTAKLAGVVCGLTTEDILVSHQADRFAWGRFNVYDFDTSATIAGKLAGWYSWIPRIEASISGSRTLTCLGSVSGTARRPDRHATGI